jgi:hypothetical protein
MHPQMKDKENKNEPKVVNKIKTESKIEHQNNRKKVKNKYSPLERRDHWQLGTSRKICNQVKLKGTEIKGDIRVLRQRFIPRPFEWQRPWDLKPRWHP